MIWTLSMLSIHSLDHILLDNQPLEVADVNQAASKAPSQNLQKKLRPLMKKEGNSI